MARRVWSGHARRRVLLAAIGLLHGSAGAATVRGTVRVGEDTRPLGLVQVSPLATWWASAGPTPLEQGRFELTLLAPGVYRVRVLAPGMAEAAFPVWVGAADEVVSVDVALGADRVLPARGVPFIRGEWTGFKSPEPMTPARDGTFVLEGESALPRVRYCVERDTALGPDRRPNPGEPKRETMEHRFVSVADVVDGRFQIRFDPASVPVTASAVAPVVTYRKRPDLQAAWEVEALEQRLQDVSRYAREVLQVPHDVPDPALTRAYKEYKRRLARTASSGPRLGREFAAAHLLRRTRDLKERARLLRILGLRSPGWAASPPLSDEGRVLGVVLAPADEAAYVASIERLASEHPDPAVRALTRMGLASRARREGDAVAEEKHAAELRRSFSDQNFVQHWFKERDARPYALAAGMPFPALGLKTSSGEAIDGAYFSAAKLTVAVFSSPSCGSCRLMLPDLRRVRSAYGPGDLRVVTFHAGKTPAYVKHELEAEPQPWDHVVLSEDLHPLEQACDVRFFPTVLLLDSGGRVLSRDDDLWVRLERAVPEHLAALGK